MALVLPPANCPELNPQANVSQFMRDNWPSNHIFKSYDQIVDPCSGAWKQAHSGPGASCQLRPATVAIRFA
jgi:hypothetical protein